MISGKRHFVRSIPAIAIVGTLVLFALAMFISCGDHSEYQSVFKDKADVAADDTSFENAQDIQNIDDLGIDDTTDIDQMYANGIDPIMRSAKVIPRLKDGRIDGFKVLKIKKDSRFEKLGLINGDVILQINDIKMTDPEDALKLFEAFKTAKSITLEIERDGARKTLSYTVR